ncbi:MAG: quinone-dependent dihydroorotate dehydrogenase [Candidatus Poseidoniales archaeon]|nr:MAG: quinone-dependent dihydroorotate dehydrogenase [Candidatus Poseidoniales archaeon]
MGLGFRLFARPIIALQDSERAHSRALKLLKLFSSNPFTRIPMRILFKPKKKIPITFLGTTYDHPLGLAAGMDKKAEALRGWENLGLGFIEIGGVTELEQQGNPKPRMFRSDSSNALVNRMGFNNPGSEKTAQNLKKHFDKFGRPNVPLWVNLGKSKLTPLDKSSDDYSTTFMRLWDYGDVFVINVSSPNTPNLRELQNDDELAKIISACQKINKKMSQEKNSNLKPILVKIAPELDDVQLKLVVNTAMKSGCDGIVATNTTTTRPVPNSKSEEKVFSQKGGMSGKPLKKLSTEFIKKIYLMTDGKWPIIGVGGIMSADDAWEKITAGATLIQAYSGFVFEGAGITKSIVKGLQKKLDIHGLSSLQDAVGLSHKIEDVE